MIIRIWRAVAGSDETLQQYADHLERTTFVEMAQLPGHLGAARATRIKGTENELTDQAGVGLGTNRNFEAGATTLITNDQRAIRSSLQRAGIEVIDATDTKGVGVRLADPPL